MRTVVSRSQVKKAKQEVRSAMKEYRVTVKEVGERSAYHLQSVKDALNPEERYWNQDIVDLAHKIVEEKKQPNQSPVNNSICAHCL